ncbi:glycosyltransferase family 2 protein [Anoxybacterium hadale]|uniref:Glycosyltransferase family 2 protein n=1 Tax=Anoxybacterium hadale TaxID=3408580 RepID=A0ACD1AEX8_9FIRM|nr:glycosyltransferase family 2 protein [Clostridiales bacterium]
MKDYPKITIIIPIYNAELHLEECLFSVTNQTYENLEIICINDGSTDTSAKIIENAMIGDRRIKLINQDNRGVASARNVGIKEARGKYICFVDADDLLSFNACEILSQETLDEAVDIVVFGAQIITNSTQIPQFFIDAISPRKKKYSEFKKEALFDEKGACPFVWNSMYRRDFLYNYSLFFDESIILGEDHAFKFISFPRARGILFIEKKIYYYRYLSRNSSMRKLTLHQNHLCAYHLKLINSIASTWKRRGDMHDMSLDFLSWCIDFMAYDILSLPFKQYSSNSKNLIKILNENDALQFKKNLKLKQKLKITAFSNVFLWIVFSLYYKLKEFSDVKKIENNL